MSRYTEHVKQWLKQEALLRHKDDEFDLKLLRGEITEQAHHLHILRELKRLNAWFVYAPKKAPSIVRKKEDI